MTFTDKLLLNVDLTTKLKQDFISRPIVYLCIEIATLHIPMYVFGFYLTIYIDMNEVLF
jgi:hypothetical protein